MAAKEYPLAPAVPAGHSTSAPIHVWAFDLGKAVRGGNEFKHKASLLIPHDFAETKSAAHQRRMWHNPLSASTEESAGVRSRKYYFDGGQVEIDADGKELRVVKLTDYTAEKVRTLCASPDELRARWADAGQRADIIQQLAERGMVGGATCTFQQVAAQAGQPDADPFDLLCHLAFHAPVRTRRQRADRVKKQQAAMFNYLRLEAREILDLLLEKYASDGELQFTLPDVLKVPPISQRGNVNEIVGKFGGADQLRNAANQLQSLQYAG